MVYSGDIKKTGCLKPTEKREVERWSWTRLNHKGNGRCVRIWDSVLRTMERPLKKKKVFSGEVTLYIKGCAKFKKPGGAT